MLKFTAKVELKEDHLAEFEQGLKALAERETLVGFPESAPRPHQPGDPPEGMTNAQLGFIHDHGSPAAGIPARPFMRPGIESQRDAITKHLTRAADAALDGNQAEMNRGYEAAGLVAVSGIKNTIVQGIPPPLAPLTLVSRRRRGLKGTKPLVATSQMLQAITYVVRKKS